MWIRQELKARAKAVLKNNYWTAFWVGIVIAIASGGFGSGSSNRNSRSGYSYEGLDMIPDYAWFWIISVGLVIILFVILVAVAFRTFLGFPLEVGGRKYFIQSAQYRYNKGCFGFSFKSENYWGIVSAMFLRGLQNFLWFLLLIVPGIVKAYAYRMVPYILADNPHIGAKKAIALSNQMTKGHKFNIFIMDLSFLGWYILGLLALVIGVLFVNPYAYATNAELYLALRKNALDNNMCTYEDLKLDIMNI